VGYSDGDLRIRELLRELVKKKHRRGTEPRRCSANSHKSVISSNFTNITASLDSKPV
jgi:hypothetical protein